MVDNDFRQGLSEAEVEDSRRLHGSNVLTPAARQPWWKLFLAKFSDPLIVILLVAGVLSIAISFYEYFVLGQGNQVFFEPVGIFMAIILATGLAFLFELKAEKEFAILNKVNDDEPVEVMRGGSVKRIPKRDVVVGDVVLLSTGQEVPADGKLLEAVILTVDESTLTGEPSCHKTTDEKCFDADATFPSDEVLRGTKIMEGHGVMRVTAVGDATENGRVLEATHIDDSVKTPLSLQLDKLGRLISIASYVIGSLVIVGRIAMYFINVDFEWISFLAYLLQSVMIAVTLVVVAVPEGLPMAVTLSLAYSMRRMLKTNNLVRKLHACETMGATTVICTDKTGTLTQNRMQVCGADFFGDTPKQIIYEGAAVNATAELEIDGDKVSAVGNPTEGALLLWLQKNGEDYRKLRAGVKRVEELPFSTERKYMATVVERPSGNSILYVKGAPEIVYSLCTVFPDGADRQSVQTLLLGYQNQAMRTLGFAYKELSPGESPIKDGKVEAENLEFLGVVAISDPVRDDVPDAVKAVTEAGIGVKIVTGDTPATAREIGRRVGLWHDGVDSESALVTGPDIAAMSDDELRRRVGEIKIIARARPLDKKRLVEALQSRGEVVAVTGDGTNDAPALKAAHVGLSMGDGTAVAKEASDITIMDNSFASIVRAVMWGRSLYRNIQRFIMFQLTVNVAACLVVLLGAFMGMQSPLTVTQMLWVNLIMDTFAAVGLASLPPSAEVMREKPRRRSDSIITPPMRDFILGMGLAFFCVMAVMLYYFDRTDITSLSQIGCVALHDVSEMTLYEITVFFTVFVFLQFWNMFNARLFGALNPYVLFHSGKGFFTVLGVILVGQIAIVEIGGEFFNVMSLDVADWMVIIGVTSAVAVCGFVYRWLRWVLRK